jgi:5-formyltetrahydrofolate cyclo-ligase
MPAPREANGWRKAARQRLVAARLAIAPEQRIAASAAISAALEARFPPGCFALLGAYWPIQGEYNPLGYLRKVIDAGKAVALPAVTAPDAPLEFRPWTTKTRMEQGRWDILHPAQGPAMTPDALLIPLVGFDGAGHRLGYGGGYYDRTLAALAPRPLAIGVGFEVGRIESFEAQPHDARLDVIVTEAGAFETGRAAPHLTSPRERGEGY